MVGDNSLSSGIAKEVQGYLNVRQANRVFSNLVLCQIPCFKIEKMFALMCVSFKTTLHYIANGVAFN